ncbi:hypothetical protein O181_080459 [Austropuccinia psidii MF-1]|uniref:Fe2OG dioxygenase domain-containing protein n=1 Tax=Austropuccinia psidii MF-1 TaxID=1389203 RepID=A0A9Q3IJ74_9BASI|nr:hypothetical protein [Austropuccinia psidii MF-1]
MSNQPQEITQTSISRDEALAKLLNIFEDVDCQVLLDSLIKNNGDLQITIDSVIRSVQQHQPQIQSKTHFKRQKITKSNSIKSWLNLDQSINQNLKSNNQTSSHIIPSTSSHGSQNSLRSLNDVLGRSNQTVSKSNSPKLNSHSYLPPLSISTPKSLSENLPCCSLIYNVLPKDLASRLYLQMIKDCQGLGNTHSPWIRNQWWLNDRQVQSPHLTAFFISKSTAEKSSEIDYNQSAQYWYAGKALEENSKPRYFSSEMEQAKVIIDPIVNKLLANDPQILLQAQRDPKINLIKRYDQEWDGPWSANVAASNCYRGSKESVGWHADQLTYLGPYPTIASLSLGTTRQFRLRPVPHPNLHESSPIRTYSITLPHNSLLVMHGGCQEYYKHCIPTQPSLDVFHPPGQSNQTFIERINITFRFYRPDFLPIKSTLASNLEVNPKNSYSPQKLGTPRCHCGIPAILRADQKGRAANSKNYHNSTLPVDINQSNQSIEFFWQCQAGLQNSGKNCKFFKFLDLNLEGRGPCIGDRTSQA